MGLPIQIVFDSLDPDRLATFWAAALHYEKEPPPPGFASWPEFLASEGVPREEWNAASAVVDPQGKGPRIYFQQGDEPKTMPNRVHLDVTVGGASAEAWTRILAEVERLQGLGATKKREVEDRGARWIVLQDPEGNEFCVQ